MDFNLLPEIIYPELRVITYYPDATPEKIKNLVTEQVERVVSSLKGVRKISSISEEGLSTVQIKYQWGINLSIARIELRERLDLLSGFFPREVKRPIILDFRTSNHPIMGFILYSDDEEWEKLYEFSEFELKPKIERVKGIARVVFIGAEKPEIKIKIHPDKLKKYNLGISEIRKAIEESNKTFPVGAFQKNNREYLVRVDGEAKNLRELGDIVIKESAGRIVPLKEIASIYYGNAKVKIDALYRENSTVNSSKIAMEDSIDSGFKLESNIGVINDGGNNPVIGFIYKKPQVSILRVSQLIDKKLSDLRRIYRGKIQILEIFDESMYVHQELRNLITAILLGILFTIIGVLVWLRRFNLSVIIIVTIPISIISTFLFMKLFGISVNILTLGGFTLSVGIIVDNAVIVVTSVYRTFSGSGTYFRADSKDEEKLLRKTDIDEVFKKKFVNPDNYRFKKSVRFSITEHSKTGCYLYGVSSCFLNKNHLGGDNKSNSTENIFNKKVIVDVFDSRVKRIIPAVAAATLTTVVVFLPVLFLSGVLRILFMRLSLVLVVSLLISLVASVTIIPVLLLPGFLREYGFDQAGINRELRKNNKGIQKSNVFSGLLKTNYGNVSSPGRASLRISEMIYEKLLTVSLKLRHVLVILLAIVTAAGVLIFPLVNKQFIESYPRDYFFVKLFIKSRVPLTYTKRFAEYIASIFMKDDRISRIIGFIGKNPEESDFLTGSMEGENAIFFRIYVDYPGIKSLSNKKINSVGTGGEIQKGAFPEEWQWRKQGKNKKFMQVPGQSGIWRQNRGVISAVTQSQGQNERQNQFQNQWQMLDEKQQSFQGGWKLKGPRLVLLNALEGIFVPGRNQKRSILYETMKDVESLLSSFTDVDYLVSIPDNPIKRMLSDGGNDITVRVFDDSQHYLDRVLPDLKQVIYSQYRDSGDNLPGIVGSYSASREEHSILLDKKLGAMSRVDVVAIGELIRASVSGVLTGSIRRGDYNIPINLSIDSPAFTNPEEILNLKVKNSDGIMIALSSFCVVKKQRRSPYILREDQKTFGWLGFSIPLQGEPELYKSTGGYGSGDPGESIGLNSTFDQTESPGLYGLRAIFATAGLSVQKSRLKNLIVQEPRFWPKKKHGIRETVDDFCFTRGLYYSYEDQFSVVRENAGELMLALFLAIFLEYVILASIFKSFTKPFLVISMIFIALPGILFLLYITGTSLTLTTFMGIIVLVGLLVNNAIMLFIEFSERNVRTTEELVRASISRIKPIGITSLSTILALIPSLFLQNNVQVALSFTLILGLVYSTVITMFFMPVFYRMIYIKS